MITCNVLTEFQTHWIILCSRADRIVMPSHCRLLSGPDTDKYSLLPHFLVPSLNQPCILLLKGRSAKNIKLVYLPKYLIERLVDLLSLIKSCAYMLTDINIYRKNMSSVVDPTCRDMSGKHYIKHLVYTKMTRTKHLESSKKIFICIFFKLRPSLYCTSTRNFF